MFTDYFIIICFGKDCISLEEVKAVGCWTGILTTQMWVMKWWGKWAYY